MNSFIIQIIYLFFIWYLEIAAEDQKASWRENIVADFYPGLASGISIPSDIGHSAVVAAIPAYELSSLNRLYDGRGLYFGVSTPPGIPLTSETGHSTRNNTSTIPSGNIISSGENITNDISQSSETTFLSGTGVTAGVGAGSGVEASSAVLTFSPDGHSSKSSHQYPTDTASRSDLTSIHSKSSETTLNSGPHSLTGTYPSAVTPPPFGYKLYSRAGIKKEKGVPIPHYLNRAGIDSGIGLSVGSEPGSGVDTSLPISQSSEKHHLSGVNAIPRVGIVSKSNTTSTTGFSTGTKNILTSGTVGSTEKVRYRNNLSSGARLSPIDQYKGTTHSSRPVITSAIEVQGQVITPPPPFSIQIDRPFFISMSQKISEPAEVPQPVTVFQNTPATVANNVPDPVPQPVPFLRAILVPIDAAPTGKSYY